VIFKKIRNFTIIDTETTGFGSYSKLIEFAGIKFRDGKEVGRFETFVNPNTEIPEKITNLTGISTDMVKNAPTAREITEKIYSFIGDDILVAQNARFDIDVLNRRLEKGLRNRFVDTLAIFKSTLELDSYKLEAIKDYFNIDVPQNHRALDDVLLTYKCLKKINYPYEIIINPPVVLKGNYCPDSLKETDKISNILNNCHCVVTGTIPRMSKLELHQLIANNGGTVGDNVILKTKYLIVGEAPGKRKIEKAKQRVKEGYNIQIINYLELFSLININIPQISTKNNDIEEFNLF